MNANRKNNAQIYIHSIMSVLLVSFCVFLANFANAQQSQIGEGVAAIVNDEPITSFDLKQRTRFLLISSGVEAPTQEMLVQASQQALNTLINERLQIQEARKFKVVMSDDEVDSILTRQSQQNGATLQQFYNDLAQAGISPPTYRDKTRAEVLWQRIVRGRYGSRVKISREQVDDALTRIIASADKPQYQATEIFIEVASPDESEQASIGAANLVSSIRSGANFARVAQQFSFAPSAATGGDLGWVTQGELRPEVAAVIDNIQPGTISDPIPVQGGLMIVGVRAKRAGQAPISVYNLREISKTVEASENEAAWQRAITAVQAAKNSLRGGCEGAQRAAQRNNLNYQDLGRVNQNDFDEPYKSQLNGLRKDATTAVFRSDTGVHLMVVCDVELTGEDIPSRTDIEDSMFDQELSLIARRYIRDIRREAAIVTRR